MGLQQYNVRELAVRSVYAVTFKITQTELPRTYDSRGTVRRLCKSVCTHLDMRLLIIWDTCNCAMYILCAHRKLGPTACTDPVSR